MPKKILAKLRDLDLAVAGIALGVLIFYTFIGVVMRKFFNRPLYFGEELQLICIVVVVFFGAGAGFRVGSHVAIDFLVEVFSPKFQFIMTVFIHAVSTAIMLYFFVQSSVFVRQMYETQRITDILRIPFYKIYSVFPIGCALIIINYTIATYSKYFKPKNKADDKEASK